MGLFKKAVDRLVSDKVPHKRRKRMIIFVALITVLSMVTSTVAWFTVNTFAGVKVFEINISTGQQLKVSMENHGTDLEKYTNIITNEMVNSYLGKYNTTLNDLLLAPVTTNNGTTFTYQRGQEVKENEQGTYLEFKCWFIGTCDMYVHLTTEGNNNDDGNGVGTTRITSSSPAPQSEIVQAVRMSFDANDNDNSYKTWEPNKGAQVTSLTTFDLPGGTMVYGAENQLFHLNALEPKEVTLRLWMEGEDPQCDDDVKGAQMSVELSFVACNEHGEPIT